MELDVEKTKGDVLRDLRGCRWKEYDFKSKREWKQESTFYLHIEKVLFWE